MASYGGRSYDRDRDGPNRGADYAGRTTSVFVGNLPYDCTEQRLIEVFSTVGGVSNARLVFDHGTGKMKGFGFVEFHDPDTASSAVRNLNGSDLDGRQLRVDHAEPDQRTGQSKAAGGTAGPSVAAPMRSAATSAPLKAAVPQGISLAPGQSATDAISQTLATIPPAQLMEILSQMKGLVTQSPDKARALLNEQPQLAYALFQAMLMMKIVDGNILMRMVQNNAPAAQSQTSTGYPGMPATGFTPAPPTADPYGGYRQPAPMPQPVSYAPPPQAAPAPAAGVSPEYQQVLTAALSLDPSQLMALPEEQRKVVMQIRQQYGVR